MGFSLNGKMYETRDEFVYAWRGFGKLETDEELLAYAEKVTGGFSQHGWKRGFLGYYISDYACDSLVERLTKDERLRLVELQKKMRAEWKAADEAREWKLVDTLYWADNSIEEIWEDKDGIRKTVTVCHPHGDLC